MSKQDKTYSRTPEDIERKYNLGQLALGGGAGDSGQISQVLQELSEYKTEINGKIKKVESMAEESQADIENHASDASVHVTQNEKGYFSTAYSHSQKTGNPHNTSKVDVGLGSVDNTADIDKPVSQKQQEAIDEACATANAYTDEKISELINGAPATLDTLKEIADAMTENEDVVNALEESIGKKANQDDLTAHASNSSHISDAERATWNAKVAKTTEYYGDIDKLVTSGFYRVGTNANLPSGYEYGQIIVSRGSDTVVQICGSYRTGKIITRGCNSPDTTPNWSEWVEYATKEDLEGLGGGNVQISYEEENEALTFLPATDVQPAWNLLAEKSGTNGTITLPTVFNELHVVIGTDNYMYTFNVLANYLTGTAKLFRNGYAISDSVYGDAYISVTKTAITGWTARKEGVLQEVNVKVYYR